jgi:hypothetical protein
MNGSTIYILRHLACSLRRPGHWRFHAAGIAREIFRLRPQFRALLSSFAALF